MKLPLAVTFAVIVQALFSSAPAFADPAYLPVEPPMTRRSTAMMIGGGIITGIGGTAGIAGGLLIVTCPGCDGESFGPLFLGIGLIGLGVLHLGVGIPLLAVGASKVPADRETAGRIPSWAGAPGGTGWIWRF